MTEPNTQVPQRDYQQESQFWMMRYFELKQHTDQVIGMLARGPALEMLASQLKAQAEGGGEQSEAAAKLSEAVQKAAAAQTIPTTQEVTPPTPIKRPTKAPAKRPRKTAAQ